MSDFLNEIKVHFNDFVENEHFMTTLVIGAVVLGLFYYYFNIYSVNNWVNNIKSEEIQKCMRKFDSSQIYEFPNMLSDSECDKIIELSRDKVERSTVIGNSKRNDISSVRTSENTFLSNSIDPLMKSIDDRIKNIIGINPENYEDLQVVHYKPGTFYKAHWDACDPNKDPRCSEDYKKGGFRFATFLLYLNDDMEGGETDFPLIGKKIKPEKGKGVLFFNLEDDLSKRRELSKHAGLPPTKGEKWMCNKWIRLGKFPR
jgi:prolyl 4-hydroxylase|tara:strand:+ start:193 stop:966 length:774 start_codon:yes stop_codon:yes gene_type:complete